MIYIDMEKFRDHVERLMNNQDKGFCTIKNVQNFTYGALQCKLEYIAGCLNNDNCLECGWCYGDGILALHCRKVDPDMLDGKVKLYLIEECK